MPRTIRKRQLRNKKSRKQRGGLDQNQINQIKSIQTTINENINKLVELLGNNVLDESVNLPIKTKPIAESQQENNNSVAIDNNTDATTNKTTDATPNKITDNTNDNNSI